MKFARIVFRIAGIYGIAALIPQYFMEERIGRDFPPPITHPELFYGFLGVALAWQFVFFLIARDPCRYRPIIWFAILEKLAFGIPCVVLFASGKLAAPVFGAGATDLILCTLFAIAIHKTRACE